MSNTQLAKKIMELPLAKGLGEDICKLLHGRGVTSDNSVGNQLFTHKMTIHFDMFGTFMKDRISGNV